MKNYILTLSLAIVLSGCSSLNPFSSDDEKPAESNQLESSNPADHVKSLSDNAIASIEAYSSLINIHAYDENGKNAKRLINICGLKDGSRLSYTQLHGFYLYAPYYFQLCLDYLKGYNQHDKRLRNKNRIEYSIYNDFIAITPELEGKMPKK